MAKHSFDPPLRLAGAPNVLIHSLDEAADYMRFYEGARRPMTRDSVLHHIEGAKSAEEQRDAANTFRAWAETEALLIDT